MLLHSYTGNKVSPLYGDAKTRAISQADIADGFYAAGTLLCWTAAGAWETWAYANDPAVKGMASLMVAYDTNVTSSGAVFGDVNATVPDNGGFSQTIPVYFEGDFKLTDVQATQRATITTANLAAKHTGLKLKGSAVVTLL